ncbi:MAG: hypothetical protein ACTSQY_10845 [Candidatus Odinarchaeia archaeon]
MRQLPEESTLIERKMSETPKLDELLDSISLLSVRVDELKLRVCKICGHLVLLGDKQKEKEIISNSKIDCLHGNIIEKERQMERDLKLINEMLDQL